MPRQRALADGTLVDFTPEEEAEADARLAANEARAALVAADVAREGGIKAEAFVQGWDDALRAKSYAEIKTLFDNSTAQDKTDILLYLLLDRALKVKQV